MEKRKETKYGTKIADEDKPVLKLSYDEINVGDEIIAFHQVYDHGYGH